MPLLFLLLFLGGALSAQAAPPVPITLANPGFETPYNSVPAGNANITGVVANGWIDNSAFVGNDVSVQYARETTNPHSGASGQKVTVTAVKSGIAQFFNTPPITSQGGVYTFSIWIRGDSGAQATLRIQQGTAPFANYGRADALLLTVTWQLYTNVAYVPANVSMRFPIVISGPETMWVDDASLTFAAGPFPPTPQLGPISTSFFGMHVQPIPRNKVLNEGFEPPFGPIGDKPPASGS